MDLGFPLKKNLDLDRKTPFSFGKMEVAKAYHPNRKVRNPMVQHNSLSEKGQERISAAFSALQIGHLLRNAGISKSFGWSSLAIFRLIFVLVFEGRNWFRLLNSDRRQSLPGKDVVYRFLNHPRFAWRRFLHALSLKIVQHFDSLTSPSRIRAFIVDDSVLRYWPASSIIRRGDIPAATTCSRSDGRMASASCPFILSCSVRPSWRIAFAR